MHPKTEPNVPPWVGFIFLALGLLILVFSPKLVASQLSSIRSINCWLLNLVGYDGKFFLSQSDGDPENESGLDQWRRASTWFGIILVGLMFILFGVGSALNLGVKANP